MEIFSLSPSLSLLSLVLVSTSSSRSSGCVCVRRIFARTSIITISASRIYCLLFKYVVSRRVSLVSSDEYNNNNNNNTYAYMWRWTMHIHSRALHAVVDLYICFYLQQWCGRVLCIQMVCLGQRERKKQHKFFFSVHEHSRFRFCPTITFHRSYTVSNWMFSVGSVDGIRY